MEIEEQGDTEEYPSKITVAGIEINMTKEQWDTQESYLEQFRDAQQKKPKIGQNHQVEYVPLITDLTYYEYLQDLENDKMSKCQIYWDPTRLPES